MALPDLGLILLPLWPYATAQFMLPVQWMLQVVAN